MENIRLGDLLIEYKRINRQQLEQALAIQKQKGGKKRLGEILIELGFVSEKEMLQALAQRLNLRYLDIDQYIVDMDAVEKLPQQIAVRYTVLAVKSVLNQLTLFVTDPLDFYALEDVRQITGQNLEIVLSERAPLLKAIDYYYSEVAAKIAARKANISELGAQVVDEYQTTETDDPDAPVVKLINSLIMRAYNTGASDIHIEPFENETVVRMRVDGVIVEYVKLQKTLHSALIARIKIIANLDIAEKRLPQDGHFKIKIENEDINARVSLMPTVFGEKAVLRLLSSNIIIDHKNHFGMSDDSYEKFSRMIKSPNGIIYITGPTGSGKTTTLYMVLETLAQMPVNIATIEDPVEKNIPKVNQVQVNNVSGLTFERGLRSLLRQDPDIILIGETRDAETAQISVRAALTGHLVLSTLHTNDAVSSVVRLGDMGLEPYMIANSLVGIIAQRLVRKVCPNCAYEDVPNAYELELVGADLKKVVRGKGCHQCNNTGYRGRIAIHEVLFIDKPLRRLISEGTSSQELETYARETQGFRTLREVALDMVREGVTTLDELQKVIYTTF
ncbi:MAG: ATPase, T2SS/T4P/T4SS family [Clostridia bacterium]